MPKEKGGRFGVLARSVHRDELGPGTHLGPNAEAYELTAYCYPLFYGDEEEVNQALNRYGYPPNGTEQLKQDLMKRIKQLKDEIDPAIWESLFSDLNL